MIFNIRNNNIIVYDRDTITIEGFCIDDIIIEDEDLTLMPPIAEDEWECVPDEEFLKELNSRDDLL